MSHSRILFYAPALGDGGAERLWAALATEFRRTGREVHFAQDYEASENQSYLDPDIPIHTLGRGHAGAVRRLARLLGELRPGVAFSAVGGSNLKLLLANAIARTQTRPVISFHGSCEYRTGKLSYATFRLLPVLSRRAARTIAVSHGLRQTLISRWGADPERTITIHNPVHFPNDAHVPSRAELSARPPVILSVGRLAPEKNFPALVRAFARLDQPDARLVILGKGPEHSAIIAEVQRSGVADRVSLPGFVDAPWPAYAKARLFVSSSVTEEFGNAVVEALAYGLPVVATSCPGPREILDDGRYGAIVGVGDEVAMADAIAAALADPGDPGVRRARADAFAFATRFPAYEALLDEVLAQTQPRALQTARMEPDPEGRK